MAEVFDIYIRLLDIIRTQSYLKLTIYCVLFVIFYFVLRLIEELIEKIAHNVIANMARKKTRKRKVKEFNNFIFSFSFSAIDGNSMEDNKGRRGDDDIQVKLSELFFTTYLINKNYRTLYNILNMKIDDRTKKRMLDYLSDIKLDSNDYRLIIQILANQEKGKNI